MKLDKNAGEPGDEIPADGLAGGQGIAAAATTEGLPVAPSLDISLLAMRTPHQSTLVDRRVVLISILAVIVAIGAALVARCLTGLIGLVTNLTYYGKFSTSFSSPAGHHMGPAVILIPAIGGLVVGIMARYGSAAIRGHGIPEAMETILLNQSRIPPRLIFLKPISAAIAIGTGGPFGAEGPIIATGSALGSALGQILRTTASERKTLLAAGAAAGMTATFGCPIAAVLLAVELLLFEFKPRSLIPVALASATATGVRYLLVGSVSEFAMHTFAPPGPAALAFYIALGAIVGVASVGVTKLVYAIEDGYDHLPFNAMWWPALGGLAVGICGYISPRTLGVGYNNIADIVNGGLALNAVLVLCTMKLISWAISLGSGTSGGTLAPIFTIGGGLGLGVGAAAQWIAPSAGIDISVAALVGMAALFAGASRALLASVVFAFEVTMQPSGLLPLLGGCTTAYFVSCLMMHNTIMTEKIARRGTRVPSEYGADFLDQVHVADVGVKPVVCLYGGQSYAEVRSWIAGDSNAAHHQGYPLLNADQHLLGVVTRRDLLDPNGPSGEVHLGDLPRRNAAVVYDDNSLREAADHMVNERVGRLPVVTRAEPDKVIGIITRGDLLSAHSRRLDEKNVKTRSIDLRGKTTPPLE